MGNVEFDKHDPTSLTCPQFHGQYLHHDVITVFEREREDAPSQALVVAGRRQVSSVDDPRAGNNPSTRRDGVPIRFWCETCPAISELTMAQHKGLSLLEWRPVGRRVSYDGV